MNNITTDRLTAILDQMHDAFADTRPIVVDLPASDRTLVLDCLIKVARSLRGKESQNWKADLGLLAKQVATRHTLALTFREVYSLLTVMQKVNKPGAVEGLYWYFVGLCQQRCPAVLQTLEG